MKRLTNPVRRYAWGSTDAIPRLLGVAPDGAPQAELWIGAHERASSYVGADSLAELVADDPLRLLGPRWASTGRLPFLAKVVAVAAPLSLQVHPGPELAGERYRAEQEAGIDRDSAHRSFPDDVAKVELVYAVSEFHALCGFRPVQDMIEWLRRLDIGLLRPTAEALEAGGRSALLPECERLLTAADPTDLVPLVIARCTDLAGDPAWGPSAVAVHDVARRYPSDPAVALALLLQPHRLAPGEALLISPGQPHTYLSGTAFEVQANSDNVLRAGLTQKHVDVPMLLRALDTDDRGVATVAPRPAGAERLFAVDTARLALAVVESGEAKLDPCCGPQLFCCLDGEFELADSEGPLRLGRGQAAFAGHETGPVGVSGRGALVRVTTGRAG